MYVVMKMTLIQWKAILKMSVLNHNGQLGTVCEGSFDMRDAKVTCKQGFTNTVGVWGNGRGMGKVWLNGMGCSGSESSLQSCSHNGWGNLAGSTCSSHKWDVGVLLFVIFQILE